MHKDVLTTSSKSFITDQANTDQSKTRKCTEWIQSGCPLHSNMLINACFNHNVNVKKSNDGHRQQRRRNKNQRMIGKSIKINSQKLSKIFQSY